MPRFSPDCWRILKRLSPAGLTPARLEQFRQSLWQPRVARIARHLPCLGPSSLELLGHESANDGSILSLIDNRFLHELSLAEGRGNRVPHLAQCVLAVKSARDQYCAGNAAVHQVDRTPRATLLPVRTAPWITDAGNSAKYAVPAPANSGERLRPTD